jgi:hypothetical protein
MRSSRRRLPAITLGAVLATAGLGCSSPQSYIVLLLESSSTPITNVSQITVVVSQGMTEMQTLTYPASNLGLVIKGDANAAADLGTLSVSFSGNQGGDIKFMVTALDARGCAIGSGAALISIIKGATNEGIVFLAPEEKCTGDAGAPDLPPDSGFPGCEPSGLSCPAAESCQIDCQARSNICAAAGTSTAGGSCTSTTGCAAGSQCFDYSSVGCGTQLCLRFCATDADCAALGDGGVGPGSFCRDPVACGGVTTAYHTCTFSCDPTAAAAAAVGTGCPAGLACVIPSSMDHVDCACPEATRTGKENTPCTTTAQCAPGFLCEQTCRAVCRCDASNGICTAANDCPTAGTTCTDVPKQTIYGVCL